MGRIYGYCRISTNKQSLERQEKNIRESYASAVIVREVYTGTKVEGRPEFDRLRKAVRSGDTIVFDSVSRMSRNASEGFEQYRQFFSQGVELVFIKEPHINTETFKAAMERQIGAHVQSGDRAADELVEGITAAINRYMLHLAERQIMLAFEQSEKEVMDLRQRTREGIEIARLHGKQIGCAQGRKLEVKKAAPAKKQIMKYSKDFEGTLSDTDCIKLIGIARNTYYKYKRELKEAQA